MVGMHNPHRDGDPLNPLHTSGKFMFELSGLSMEDYAAKFVRTNLVLKGGWSEQKATEGARRVLLSPSCKGGWVAIIMLGREVSLAFSRCRPAAGLEDLPLFRGAEYLGTRFIRFPHPSGRCRQWNEGQTRQAAEECLWSLYGKLRPEGQGRGLAGDSA